MVGEPNSADTIAQRLYEQKLEQERAYKREYMRQWRAKNRDKVRANNERYIIKKAESLKAEHDKNK